jgi:hypothetical protein
LTFTKKIDRYLHVLEPRTFLDGSPLGVPEQSFQTTFDIKEEPKTESRLF